jgi:hypothetical protein
MPDDPARAVVAVHVGAGEGDVVVVGRGRPGVEGLAYSSGTGVEIGMASASVSCSADGLESLKTIVWSSGVWIPGMSAMAPGLAGAPTMSPKYRRA